MAQYMLLIYEDEASWATAGPDVAGRIMSGHRTFGETNAGVLRGGEALEATGSATSVRKEISGEYAVTDGPFAETKEALGGFYLIEANDLDAALAVAKQIPAEFGGVEVRPVRVFN